MALTQAQLNALYGVNDMTPNDSAAALGHATNTASKFIGGQSTTGAFSSGSIDKLPGQIGEVVGDIANDATRFAQSAVQAPGDIINAAQGKSVDTNTLPNFTGGGQQTYQGEFQSKTLPAVESGAISPIKATMSTVGNVVGGALNFLGLGVGGKAATEVAPQVAKDVVDTVSSTAEKRSVNVATNRLASTEATMTKGEREAAIKQGRMTPGGKYTPSPTEIRAGEIMKGKTYSNPVKTTKTIQSEISTRGQAAETHLEQNVRPISNEEDLNAFQAAKANSEKYMTSAESAAYDEQVGVFQKILKSYSGNGGYTTSNYYKALKDYESQVTSNLAKGKDALLVPGGSARIQGAKDVRTVVRDMIGSKNPEFKGEMYDLASLYDSLDNVVAKAEQGGHSFAKRYPNTTRAIGTGATVLTGLVGDKILKDTTGIGF